MSDQAKRVTKGIKLGVEIVGDEREVQIVEVFSSYFGVTFSRMERFKNSRYPINFLQPSIVMQRNYNLYNEFLLLFSSYLSFDTRTFDFVDKTLEDYSNRLDKLCIFIVSDDLDFVNKVQRLINDQKDFRLVVPFTYNELLSRSFDERFLHDRMRAFLYSRDLFSFESPIQKDDYFYGRSQIVQHLYSKYCSGEQSGLFGLRKIGKTSVLYALQRMLIHRNGKSVFIDCQSPSVHQQRWYELLNQIIESVYRKYFNVQEREISGYNQKNAAINFEYELIQLNERFNGQRLLLIFDEIESITYELSPSVNWESNFDYLYFWQTIRSVYQKQPNVFSFIIAGVNPRIIEISNIDKYDNPIFSMIKPIYLDFFDYKDVKKMVSSIGGYMGITFDEEIFTHLVDDYGGHPFLIRQVCSIMNSYAIEKPVHIDKYMYREHKKDFENKMTIYVEQITNVLKNWYPHELELLSILAVEGNKSFNKKIKSSTEVDHLEGYGVLIENKGKYNITINALSTYVKSIYKDKSIPKELYDKWAKVSKRRNSLEVKIRDTILISLESNKGKTNAKNIIVGVKDSDWKKRIKGKSSRDILEHHYFFPDYVVVIRKNWQYFEKIFGDLVMFQMCMDSVNKYRIDAHAKDIDEEQYYSLDYALSWLEDKLS